MEAYRLRDKIIEEINNADEKLLKVVEDVIDNYNYSNYNIISEPLTLEQYNAEIDIAENDIANGDVFTQEEVSEIIKRWKNE